jgi:hypothetical protein
MSHPSGWPVLRTPKWMFAGGAVLVAGLTLAAIPHRPARRCRPGCRRRPCPNDVLGAGRLAPGGRPTAGKGLQSIV